MAAQAQEFIDLINRYGWAGWAMVMGFVLYKYGSGAISKVWDLAAKWFAPEAFAAREEKRKQAAKEEREAEKEEQARKDKEESDRRLNEQAMLNRAFEMMEGTTAAQVKTAVILDNLFGAFQQSRAEHHANHAVLVTRLDDIEMDINPIYTYLQRERPSHIERKQRRNPTQPNQPLPVQEVKNNVRNRSNR